MRNKTESFFINERPMLAPDGQVSITYEDLESSDSGLDEAGVRHRSVIRHKVPTWNFTYSHLTDEEKMYMESLFANHSEFAFKHPSTTDIDVMETTLCYRKNYGISLKNEKTRMWSSYNFSISAC